MDCSYQTPPRQPMSGWKHFFLSFLAVLTGVPAALMIISAGLFVISFIIGIMMLASLSGSSADYTSKVPLVPKYGNLSATKKFVSVPVRGVILSGSAADPLQTLFGYAYADGEVIKEQLRILARDSSVSGVILEIDSPGGMINASKAIADGVKYYRDTTKKPIIAHINGAGASGAYWVASTADAIYAEQGSEAGSIGVIAGPLMDVKGVVGYGDIATNEPIGFKYFTAGRSKDFGNPFRSITPDEEAYFNAQLQSEYQKFVEHVSASRQIAKDQITGQIGALAYGTDDALKFKLIDAVKSKEDAYAELASRAGVVSTDYNIQEVDNTLDFFSSLFGVRQFINDLRMSETDKSAARARFCETNIYGRPLVLNAGIDSICR